MELLILISLLIITYLLIMGRGKKNKTKVFVHSQEMKNKINNYTKEFGTFCEGKTYYSIIDDYCLFFKEENKKKIRRQYTREELNLIFTNKSE